MGEKSAAARAQWLAELAAALDSARVMIERLIATDGALPRRAEGAELLTRIIWARSETRAMQLRQSSRLERQSGPEWIKFLEGRSLVGDGAQTPSGKSPPPEKGWR